MARVVISFFLFTFLVTPERSKNKRKMKPTLINAGGGGESSGCGVGRLGVRASRGISIGHGSTDVGVADVEAGAALGIVGHLRQDHQQGVAVVFPLSYDRDAPLLQRHVLGFLRYLYVRA